MATSRRYPKAPIVQAVIDLKVNEAFSERELERLRDRFKRQFPSVEEKRNFKVELRTGTAVQQKSELAGFKMTAPNGADVVLINEASFGTVRLAPYDRWESFVEQAKENFNVFTGIVGRRSIVRIGVRFINRLDIPDRLISGEPLSKFLRVGISMPDDMTSVIGNFSFVAQGTEEQTGTPFVLRCGIMSPVLIEHVSVQLDVDAYWNTDIPTRIDEMWAGTERLRHAKNAVFEQSITDELRRLFE
ncbi:MAG: hypothetical protein C3F17_19240 [Bradyrhizobiaceae bacterium]|nr:MAG: hypothetical protein C3F17_19240 [Bradyrhizobiaceae bacterium]